MGKQGTRFCNDIGQIVDLSHCPLTVKSSLREPDRRVKHTFLSDSSFLHIYNFAMALNARYIFGGDEDNADPADIEREFNKLSLEYKIHNINQVRAFDMYLNTIDCFYTDRPVDFDMLTTFTDGMISSFAPMEHERWVRDHQIMGWTAGNNYDKLYDCISIDVCCSHGLPVPHFTQVDGELQVLFVNGKICGSGCGSIN